MQAILDTANGFFAWLWRASWQASVIVVLVLLAQWLLGRRLTPRWRHGLWLLVVLRLALPYSVQSPLSLFQWVKPHLGAIATAGPPQSSSPPEAVPEEETVVASTPPGFLTKAVQGNWLRWVWLAGTVALPSYLLIHGYWLGRKVRRQRPVTDSAVLNLLEDCKQEMGVHTPLMLVETPVVASPSLFGFIRPRLLLPAGLTRSFSFEELRYVFLHELGHVKRADIPTNWLMTAALIVHWFNPLVWYAFSRMRGDQELACDALALGQAREAENRPYGQTMIKLLEGFSRPAVVPGLVGILEDKHQMKRRISMIAKFRKTNRWPVLAVSASAVLALITLTDPPAGAGEATPSNAGGPPVIVSTSPKVGETDVSPALTEITVTFDRDMGGGFSWTGGGPDYPPTPEGQKAKWRDKRTCVLPVKLQAGRYYRVGINSTSYQNFKSADGIPARPSAIYFTTQGASQELKRRATKPMIVALEPKNGATDVDPSLKEIRVTFNVPMGGGFSWTGGGEQFPTIPEGKKPTWSADHMSCVLPVELKPGWEYHLGLNSPSHKNFQSSGGVPLDPVSYTFKTRQ